MHTYTGVPASTGIVVGPVEQIDHGTTGLHRIVCDPFRERALYDVAVVLAKDELRRLSQRAKGPDADILLFQIALLEDESFTNEIGDYIAAGAGGAAAVERAEQIFAGRLKNVDDEYIRERSVDVCDVCRRVVDILDGRPRRRLHLKRPSILVADRFFPSDLFSLDRRMVLGLASDQDSTVSHAAIMARSMGIPAVVQLGGGTAAMAVGHRAILDADNGTLIVEPDGAQIAQADCKIALSRLHGQKPDPVAALPCLTKDGKQGWTNYDGYSNINFQPGIWYVMPVTRADHMQFVGGIANKSIVQTHLFYLNLMDDIYSTYRAVQPGETPFPFTDVPESRWSYPYIKQLYDAGVVSGMTATTFAPAENMTRAQFVTMLAGLQGADVSACKTGQFTDVPAAAWYAPYVGWAAENGIVYGVSDTAFAPDADISRQDMAVMVYRYAERFGIRLGTDVPPVTFADADDIAAYALPAVQALQRAGVISGMPDGSFRPRERMTREQACVVLSAL